MSNKHLLITAVLFRASYRDYYSLMEHIFLNPEQNKPCWHRTAFPTRVTRTQTIDTRCVRRQNMRV